LEKHLELMCSTYLELVKKMIVTIYKSNKEKQDELLEKISPFENMLAGCGLMKNELTGEYIVIQYMSPK